MKNLTRQVRGQTQKDLVRLFDHLAQRHSRYGWRRLRNGSECLSESYVYTPSLRDAFGAKYYNVDLQAGLAGLRRPISFRRLLDNLKNVPQAEYLVKAGLPVLAAANLPDSGAKSLPELTGLGKQFLPAMRECQASFREAQTVASQKNPRPEDLRQLCALNLDYDSLHLLKELAHYSPLGRVLRYIEAQREVIPWPGETPQTALFPAALPGLSEHGPGAGQRPDSAGHFGAPESQGAPRPAVREGQ